MSKNIFFFIREMIIHSNEWAQKRERMSAQEMSTERKNFLDKENCAKTLRTNWIVAIVLIFFGTSMSLALSFLSHSLPLSAWLSFLLYNVSFAIDKSVRKSERLNVCDLITLDSMDFHPIWLHLRAHSRTYTSHLVLCVYVFLCPHLLCVRINEFPRRKQAKTKWNESITLFFSLWSFRYHFLWHFRSFDRRRFFFVSSHLIVLYVNHWFWNIFK